MSASMKPVVIWQRAGLRIIAVDADQHAAMHDADEAEPTLVLEERFLDALGAEAWLQVSFGEQGGGAYLLLLEIASRVEVAPSWVRTFVRAQLAECEEDARDGAGGAA